MINIVMAKPIAIAMIIAATAGRKYWSAVDWIVSGEGVDVAYDS
jgi:hypothetical protein